MRKVILSVALALAVSACDSPPEAGDIAQSLNSLAASTPGLAGATKYTVKDTYCSPSKDNFACTATATDGKTSYKVQLRMTKQGTTWTSEMLGAPTPIA